MGVAEMLIQGLGVAKSLFIAAGALPLKHRHGIKQVFARLLVGHVIVDLWIYVVLFLGEIVLELLED